MEDFILSTQIFTEFDLEKPKDYKVRAIIFLVNCKKIAGLCDENLLGKKMKDWVFDSVKPIETEFVELNDKEDVFLKAKQNIKDEDFTICLFSDTPLLKNSSVLEGLEYAQTKDLDFCKLPRGFIVKSKNFVSGTILLSSEVNFIDKEEFFTVFDFKTLSIAKDILRKRILDKHLKNGVNIEDLNSVSIDFDVEIGQNVVIKQNNILEGSTVIKDNCRLQSFNKIKDSVINENCTVQFSNIENSFIKKNSNIGPFKNIVDVREK